MAAINAGISLKSTSKNAGNGGIGKLKSINKNEILLSMPIVINDWSLTFFFIENSLLFADSILQEERLRRNRLFFHEKTLMHISIREKRHD